MVILQFDPALDGAEIVSEVEVTGWLGTGKNSFFKATHNGYFLKLLESRGIDYIVTRDDFFACDYTSDGVTITKSVLKQPESKTATNGIIIDSIDRKTEYVRIKNTTGEDADLSGYRLVSENGGETFTFPQGTTLASGQIITIVSGKAEVSGDFVWTEDKVWKNKKADKALLYDAEGTLLSIME